MNKSVDHAPIQLHTHHLVIHGDTYAGVYGLYYNDTNGFSMIVKSSLRQFPLSPFEAPLNQT